MRFAIKHRPTAEKDNYNCYVFPKLQNNVWMPGIGPKIGFWCTAAEAKDYLAQHFPSESAGEYEIEDVSKKSRKEGYRLAYVHY
jgi:hypothetical protein